MAKGLIISVIVIVLIVLGVFIFNSVVDDASVEESGEKVPKSLVVPASGSEDVEEMIAENNGNGETEVGDSEVGAETRIIEISASGFRPSVLEINQGDGVVFLNRDGSLHWPASDVHPTHRVYPGSDINKCGSASERERIFDSCHGLNQGERYSFVFNEIGNWRYHDHLRASLQGMIIVN